MLSTMGAEVGPSMQHDGRGNHAGRVGSENSRTQPGTTPTLVRPALDLLGRESSLGSHGQPDPAGPRTAGNGPEGRSQATRVEFWVLPGGPGSGLLALIHLVLANRLDLGTVHLVPALHDIGHELFGALLQLLPWLFELHRLGEA